jgi:hypothetical protein
VPEQEIIEKIGQQKSDDQEKSDPFAVLPVRKQDNPRHDPPHRRQLAKRRNGQHQPVERAIVRVVDQPEQLLIPMD